MNQVLIDAMREQLAKPARAIVNSECAFVADRLRAMGEHDLAKEYWSWNCSSWEKNPKYGHEVQELQAQLRAIDNQYTLPEWGYKGT